MHSILPQAILGKNQTKNKKEKKQFIKQLKMNTKSFIIFAACAAASALMSSCSNEENAATNGQLATFTGGIVTEAPMNRVQLGASESSTVAPSILTRTSMDRTEIGGKGTFFWEAGDVIYVQDDNNALFNSQNNIADKTARNTFSVNGAYGAKTSYDVYYHGTNSGSDPKKVVISATQTQTAFNDTKHFGASGDCGVAKATKNTDPGKSGYEFDLEHKASYLCFLPYIDSQNQRERTKIKSIEVTSDKNIAGTYALSSTGLSGEGSSKTITLRAGTDGLLLADKTVSTQSINNSLYMVVAPGAHTIKVKYTILDTKKNKTLTLTKSYGSRTLVANTIYDIPVDLSEIKVYDGHIYYMWDAKENYWSGHEWDSAEPWQPTTDYGINEKDPQSNEDVRWYHEGYTNFEASVNPLFSKLPNANEIAWYAMYGAPHWDNSTKWKLYGKTYTGGLWLKKLSVIAKERGKELNDLKLMNPDNMDMHSDYWSKVFPTTSGKPKASEIGDYFFLPALGFYDYGEFSHLGTEGDYWSSTATYAGGTEGAYILHFDDKEVKVFILDRLHGAVAQPFE